MSRVSAPPAPRPDYIEPDYEKRIDGEMTETANAIVILKRTINHGSLFDVRPRNGALVQRIRDAHAEADQELRATMQTEVATWRASDGHGEYVALKNKVDEMETELQTTMDGLPTAREAVVVATVDGKATSTADKELDRLIAKKRRTEEVLPRLKELAAAAKVKALADLRNRLAAAKAAGVAGGPAIKRDILQRLAAVVEPFLVEIAAWRGRDFSVVDVDLLVRKAAQL